MNRQTVWHWLHGENVQNFGDFISEFLIAELFYPFRSGVRGVHIVGSVLDPMFVSPNGSDERPILFWGCGLRDGKPLPPGVKEKIEVLSVRGPLSLSLLQPETPIPVGEPAFLLPALYEPRRLSRYRGKSICIPHFHDNRSDDEIRMASGCDLVVRPRIAPDMNVFTGVIDAIYSAEFVLASAMHGCAVAAAYRRPFAFWEADHIDLPFKWQDLAALLKIPGRFARDLATARTHYAKHVAPAIRLPNLLASLVKSPLLLRPEGFARVVAWYAAQPEFRDAARAFMTDGGPVSALASDQQRIFDQLFDEFSHHQEKMRGQMQELRGQTEDLRKRLQSAEAEIQNFGAIKSQLDAQESLLQLTAEKGSEIEAVRARLLAEQATSQALRAQMQDLHIQNETVQAELRNLSAVKSTLDAENDRLRQLMATQGTQIESIRSLLVAERMAPLRTILNGFSFHALTLLSRLTPPLPIRTARKLAKSARKRDPRLILGVPDISAAPPLNAPDDAPGRSKLGFKHRMEVRILQILSRCSPPLSKRMTRRFAKSARKRDPEHLIRRTEAPTASSNGARYVPLPVRENEKRVLIVDGPFPTPDRDSGSLDAINFVKIFRELGYSVYFIATAGFWADQLDEEGTEARNRLVALGVEVVDSRYERSISEFIRMNGNWFELYFLSRVHAGGLFYEDIRAHAPRSRIIFNTVDLHSLREYREGYLQNDRSKINASYRTQAREFYLARLAEATIVVSGKEREILAQQVPGARVYEIPLIREIPGTEVPFAQRAGIGFIGGYKHFPNVDAANYFLDQIWPRVHAVNPDIVFYLMGADMPPALGSRRRPGVEIVGYVPDLAQALSKLRLTVAPLRYGAGAKGKIVSSLSHGVPCVVTSVAAEGMQLDSVGAMLIADGPEDFAAAILRAYDDVGMLEDLAARGLALTRARHSPGSGKSALARIISDVGLSLPSGVQENALRFAS